MSSSKQRVFVASNTPDGIRAFDWNPATAELTYAGVAAKVDNNIDWLCFSPDRKTIFAAAELDTFRGKPTGAVASLRLNSGKLTQISAENSAAKGTCQCAIDHTGQTLLAADYGGGSAASFKVTGGALSPLVWSQHYTQHGPNPDRQESAHAHFASFSPDNRFAFINDLGGDCIHIYRLHPATAQLTAAGEWRSEPGFGPRTLHFHPNGVIAYCMNEMASTVSVLRWNKADGKFTTVSQLPLNPDPAKGPNTGCDTVITRDGRFAYFANRGDDFILSAKADPQTGALTPIAKSSHRRQNSAQLHPRSHRALDARRQPGFEPAQRLRPRSPHRRPRRPGQELRLPHAHVHPLRVEAGTEGTRGQGNTKTRRSRQRKLTADG